MDKQKTIKVKVSFEGVGLHGGQKTKIEILPAQANTGIMFIRQDAGGQLIKGDFGSLVAPEKFPRRTSIGANGIYIHTVEHLMAAFHLLKIDNVQVNVWGEEIPGMDGSAKEFVDKIKDAGIVELDAVANCIVIKEPLWVEEGSSSIVALPYPSLRISYALKYDNPLIGSGYVDLTIDGNATENVFQARTFCLEEEVKHLLDSGLGKGANHDNTLVVSKDGVLKNKLRFPDEFTRHKVLDLIGDLYLAGPVRGYIIAIKSGHSLNMKLLEKLRKYKDKAVGAGVGSPMQFVPSGNQLSSEEIMKLLPHRYPFLLVDRIVEMEKFKRAVGIKNVTMNEYFFQGHFPQRPVMPGVLIIEAMAQVGGVLMLASEENKGKLAYFMAANNAKFRKPVVPGDQLIMEVVAGKIRTKTGTVYAKAFVDDKLVAEAELMFALVD
ncbi:MAG: UDP-3-O-acyl-N-acetylglucosamine deacetylase [Candidatus Omnitrophota bacterium]